MQRTLLTIAAIVSLSSAAFADDFGGEIAAGVLSTDGNTQSKSLNGKFALDYKSNPWKNAFLATGLNTGGSQNTEAERYTVTNKLDYNFTNEDYAFGVVDFDKDLSGAIRQRTSQAVGYGHHLLRGPTHKLDLEIGGGARQEKVNETGERNYDAIGRLSGKYEWKLSEAGSLSETAKTESGPHNTFSESVTELKLPVVGKLFVSLSYTLRNNTEVPVGSENTDTSTAVTLSYALGEKQ